MRNFCNMLFSIVLALSKLLINQSHYCSILPVRLPNMFLKNIDSATILSGFNLVLILLDSKLINHLGLSFLM